MSNSSTRTSPRIPVQPEFWKWQTSSSSVRHCTNSFGLCRAKLPDRTMQARILSFIVVVLACSGCTEKHKSARPNSPPVPAVPKSTPERAGQPGQPSAQTTTAPPSSFASGNTNTTVTGCLAGSNGPTPYSLRDDRGQRYAVRGAKDLDNHVGLSGQVIRQRCRYDVQRDKGRRACAVVRVSAVSADTRAAMDIATFLTLIEDIVSDRISVSEFR
jgi:hypothetical protein